MVVKTNSEIFGLEDFNLNQSIKKGALKCSFFYTQNVAFFVSFTIDGCDEKPF